MRRVWDLNSFRGYITSIRPHLLVCTALFLASVILGYVYASLHPEKAITTFETFQRVMSQKITDQRTLPLTYAIFLNNLLASSIILFSGLGLGILSAAGVALNGTILGMVGYVVKDKSLPLLVSILPHGVIEVPIFLISAAIGLRLGQEVLNKLLRRGQPSIKKSLRDGLRFYLMWIVPLLLLAAFIEATVSMRIAQFFK